MVPGMEALPLDPIELVAVHPARNIRRRWRVSATRDLFGHVVVETSWGRIGAAGRRLIRSFADEAEAARYVSKLLRIRARAPRRIGISYMPVTNKAVTLAA